MNLSAFRRGGQVALVLASVLTASSLLVPGAAVARPRRRKPVRSFRVHHVRRGNTWWWLSQYYRMPASRIQAFNGLSARSRLKPGMKLAIPPRKGPLPERPGQDPKPAPKKPASSAGRGARSKAHKPHEPAVSARPSTKPFRDHSKHPVVWSPKHKRALKRRYLTSKERSRLGGKHHRFLRRGARPGELYMVYLGEHFRGRVRSPRGKVRLKSLRTLSKMLRSRRTGKKHSLHPRLLALFTMVSEHFGGRAIHIVSGFRPTSTNRWFRDSRHNHGNAIDFYIPGVPLKEVRRYCLGFHHVGVGYYPTSGFIHLDVRGSKTTWIDYAGPGEAPRHHPKHRRHHHLEPRPQPRSATPPRAFLCSEWVKIDLNSTSTTH